VEILLEESCNDRTARATQTNSSTSEARKEAPEAPKPQTVGTKAGIEGKEELK